LVRPDATDRKLATLNKHLIPGVAGYIAMLVLGLFAPVLAVLGYLTLAIYILIPCDMIRRRRTVR
jgi:hypothetical protein